MTYLEVLKADKQNREKFEQQTSKLKFLIMEIEALTAQYDGEYLKSIEELNKKWQSK